mgnify:FL=1|jgi:hypothetical protein
MARGSEQGETGVIYLRIADGKIVETVEAGTDGAIKRTTKPSDEHPNGREVWERRDGYVDGVITSMFHTEREYKGEKITELSIRLRDKDEHYSLKVNKGNRYWVGILSRLPNVNFQKSVRFSPYDFEGKDDHGGTRRVIGINLFQGAEKIDPAWSKTSPGDLPQGKQVRVNGKDVWDFEERDNYLMKVFADLADQLRVGDMAMGGAQEETPTKAAPTAVASVDEDDDGLPF